jgi:hypothetical protein
VYVNEVVLFDSEQKYHLMEGECYALVWAFYIFGNSWIARFLFYKLNIGLLIQHLFLKSGMDRGRSYCLVLRPLF